jgi:hypothetical protein
MPAQRLHLICEANASFSYVIQYNNPSGSAFNLTGYSASMSVADRKGNLLVSLTTSNGGIALGGILGTITLTIAAATTATFTAGTYVWDLILTSGSVNTRAAEGWFLVNATDPL